MSEEENKVVECIGLEKKYFLFEKDYKIIPWLFTKKGCSEERTPLTDINLTINKGDVVGFIGKNGAGKSTLMKIIAGITMHTAGDLVVRGKVNSLINLGAGFNIKYTGRQNIYYKGLLMGMTREDIDNILDEIIDFCDLGEYFDQPLYMYSSGMSARLGFALAIFAEHDILIVDEVFSVGDKAFRNKSAKKMEELFKSGKSIIFASHDDEQIRRFCNRAVFIDNSKIIVDGEVDEVLNAYNKKYAPNKVISSKEEDKFASIDGLCDVFSRIKFENADFYRELGLFYEREKEFELAYKYMNIARYLRPDGVQIINKSNYYKSVLEPEVWEKYTIDEESVNNCRWFVEFMKTKETAEKADIYRELALFHELEGEIGLAYKYMGYAKELRPNGSYIIQKFEEFEKRLNENVIS